jgi:hypothetical protein
MTNHTRRGVDRLLKYARPIESNFKNTILENLLDFD